MKPNMSRPAGMPSRVPMAPKMPAVRVGKPNTMPPSLSTLLGIGGPAPVASNVPLPPNGNKPPKRSGRSKMGKGSMPGMGGY